MGTLKRVRIILGIPWEDFPAAVLAVKNIAAKMTQNASIFVSPSPSMAVFTQQCLDFEAAHEAVVNTKATGATAVRVAKRDIARASSESERGYVQFLSDGSPENGASYAAAAGMRIALPGTRVHAILTAALVPGVPGDVRLRASASQLVPPGPGKARKRLYLWRHTLDGGKSFVDDDPTPVASTTVSGLPLSTVVGFQVAVKDALGVSDWCQMVSILLH
jgi:hypothetical protein